MSARETFRTGEWDSARLAREVPLVERSNGRSRLSSATGSTPSCTSTRWALPRSSASSIEQIDELRALVVGKDVTIELEPAARAWLATKGFDRSFGARPMARLIDRVIKKPLSEMLLFGSLGTGGTVRIVVEGDDS